MSTDSIATQARAGLTSERLFLGVSALLFVACAGGTVYWSRSMSMSGVMDLGVMALIAAAITFERLAPGMV